MRRAWYFCMIGLLAGMLVGCGKQQTETVEYVEIAPQETIPIVVIPEGLEEEESETESEEETTETETAVAFADEKSVVYEVTETSYEDGVIKLTYPQITGMDDETLQNSMNQAIEQEVKSDITMEGLSAYELNYEIATQGKGVFSVILRGYYNRNNQAYPVQFVKTFNLDMTTGKNLRLKDYADVAKVVSCLEQDYGYEILSEGVEMSDFSAFLNNGYMTDYAITLLDYDVDFAANQLETVGYSCIRDNRLVLFIETEHAMGDYVELVFTEPLTK